MVLKNAGILLARPNGSYLNKLVIQKVQPKDSGMFVCFATNRKGFTTRQAFLEIRQGTSFLSEGVSFIEGKQTRALTFFNWGTIQRPATDYEKWRKLVDTLQDATGSTGA